MSTKKFTNEDSFTSSDSEDLREIFRSSSSLDRSSVGSIPWAEDAIKQNQQEWERVERMFYGEEDLPDEPLLRNEILEWNRAFPHLRVRGRKVDTSKDFIIQGRPLSSDNREEIIVMHPTRQTTIEFKHDYLSKKLSARSVGREQLDLKALEKDLRISSVPMVSKRSLNIPKLTAAHVITKPFTNILPKSTNFRQIIPSKSSGSLLLRRNNLVPHEKPSNSATIIRMPPILIVPPQVQSNETSATTRRNPKATIVLPAINFNGMQFSVDNAARSAIIRNQKIVTSHLPLSASKLKFSE